ncbi:MAG: glycoside hydrolase family 3 N-terminal domain-containing protein [Chloroflexota bacterium]
MTTYPNVEQHVTTLLEQMTLAEKIGQMTQVEKGSITPAQVTEHTIGSVLSGGGGAPSPDRNTAPDWAEMVREFAEAALQTRLQIPLLYGVDAVHGHNNLAGATIFPHNIGMGAANDDDLIERIAEITATEILATNIHWTFAPAVSVPQDFRWGRTYEGFSDNTEIVTRLGTAYVRGLQQQDGARIRALVSVKHYVGDGATAHGSKTSTPWIPGWWLSDGTTWTMDQGDAQIDEETMRHIHLVPYKAAIDAGAMNIMVSYNSLNGQKMHGSRYWLTDVLKGELAFDGFLVSDWMAIDQLSEDFYTCVVTSINAGLDMVMVPFDFVRFISTLTRAVEQGDVPESRINDAVTRILRAKVMLGMFDQPLPNSETHLPAFGSDAHRAVAREAVQKSLVLLKNESALPVAKDTPTIFVAGQHADDMGMQCGGWSIEWQGKTGDITTGTTILEGIRSAVADGTTVTYSTRGVYPEGTHAEVGIAVIGEPPYAEGEGDRDTLTLSAEDMRTVERLRAVCGTLVIVLVSGRPLEIVDVLEHADAFVAAFLPGTEGAGVADVLFGDVPFTGKLSYTWPRSSDQLPLNSNNAQPGEALFPIGHGL